MITLYSTGCPKCNVLKRKLDEANIEYVINTDEAAIIKACEKLETDMLPILEIEKDGNKTYCDFGGAIKWVGEHNV